MRCWKVGLKTFSETSNKVPVVQPSHGVHPLTPLIPYSNEHFSHGSHSPHLPADISQKQGVHRPSQTSDISGFYSLPPSGVGQITPTMGCREDNNSTNNCWGRKTKHDYDQNPGARLRRPMENEEQTHEIFMDQLVMNNLNSIDFNRPAADMTKA
ncbi:Lymphoid enhancer-binding factor 1 [Varanus komodoensis]|nr:Lymphoid enhancer-binding factor 1 [Varanus komodoensis]